MTNPKASDAAVNAAVNAVATLLNTGYMRIYSGTQPANANTALSGNTLLAELRFANPAFGAAAAGIATANAITSDTDADATGTATFFRNFKSDGTTVVCDGSIGTAGADINLGSVLIQQHAQVEVTAYTLTLPEG